MADLVQYYGTGRRKSAIARVFLRPGNGEFSVNGKAHDVYFVTEQQRIAAKRSLVLTEMAGSFNVLTTVRGGGVSAQADAVKMGIARIVDAGCANQGTEEVRAEGCSEAVPVLEAVVCLRAFGCSGFLVPTSQMRDVGQPGFVGWWGKSIANLSLCSG
jgi:ribosomal protein S9